MFFENRKSRKPTTMEYNELLKANESLRDVIKNAKAKEKALECQLLSLTKTVEELKTKVALETKFSEPDDSEEERIVNEETEWLVQKAKSKKRKMMSPVKISDNSPINKTDERKSTDTKARRPPPMVVSKVTEYPSLIGKLNASQKKYTTKMINDSQVKINTENAEDYREISKILNENKLKWHTYENKQTRPIRVVVRNLHKSCDVDEIKDDLQGQGFNILQVTNLIKKIKENNSLVVKKLPLFMLSFSNDEDIKKIYDIKYICHMAVRIEAVRNSKQIPQCKTCQSFGHTKAFCARDPKCVKCAGDHLTMDCDKNADCPPQCANCGEKHPANYRGCIVAKELQKRRNEQRKPKSTDRNPRSFDSKTLNPRVSFAQATTSASVTASVTDDINKTPSLTEMMSMLLSKFDEQEKTLNHLARRLEMIENSRHRN